MGATASFPDRMTAKETKAAVGGDFDEKYFDENSEEGTISKDQLLAYFLQREKLRVAFDQVDTDSSGYVSRDEMEQLFDTLELDKSKLPELIKSLDANGDDKISFHEFAGGVNLGGTRGFEKALTKALTNEGKIQGALSLQGWFEKTKEQAKAAKEAGDEEALKTAEGKMMVLSAKLASLAISEEKQLFRAFRELDSDGSGKLDKDEMKQALDALGLAIAKADDIYAALGGMDGADEGVTFDMFKQAVSMGGGKSFEKALKTKILHNFKDGELANFDMLGEQLAKRKQQVTELKAQLEVEPDNEELQKQLKKRKQQGEALAAKMKAVASIENRKLKNLFMSIDTDGSGTIDGAEIDEALTGKTGQQLASVDGSVLRKAVANAPGGQLDYNGWKTAIKAAGGPMFTKLLFSQVDASGKLKGILTLSELYQQKKEQCKALKKRIEKGEPFRTSREDIEADLKKRESQLEALSAKLKAKAVSDEKKLLRAFKEIDTDDSGRLGRVELEGALTALQLDVADAGKLFESLGGVEGEGITFDQFKAAVKVGGGKSFEKALGAKVMHDGELATWEVIEQAYAKRKAQVKEVQAKVDADPENADLQAELKKRMTQCDAIAAKGKAFASDENQRLKTLFADVDTSGNGTIELNEMEEAVKTMDLASVDSEKLIDAVKAAPDQKLDYEGWKQAIRDAGGKKFVKALERYIGADGKMVFGPGK